jgi:hypothetical protein
VNPFDQVKKMSHPVGIWLLGECKRLQDTCCSWRGKQYDIIKRLKNVAKKSLNFR